MFAQPETWVAVAFVLLMVLFAYLGIHKTVLTALDHRAERIKAELDEARQGHRPHAQAAFSGARARTGRG